MGWDGGVGEERGGWWAGIEEVGRARMGRRL